jgi:hypothetical protein
LAGEPTDPSFRREDHISRLHSRDRAQKDIKRENFTTAKFWRTTPPQETKKGECYRSTEGAIVVPRQSWRKIFLWKTLRKKKGAKKKEKPRPVETDASDGNPQRTRIPTEP